MRMFSKIVFILMCFLQVAEARQFRAIAPIPVAPETGVLTGQVLKGQSNVVVALSPVDKSLIETAVKDILDSWNQQDLADYLDELFAKKSQLLSTIQRDIPKDAKLRLLSLQNIATIAQKWDGKTRLNKRSRTSTVVSTVSLQLEFVDPFKGVVVIPHTSQFYLQVVETE